MLLAPLIDDQNRELQDIEAWIESADAPLNDSLEDSSASGSLGSYGYGSASFTRGELAEQRRAAAPASSSQAALVSQLKRELNSTVRTLWTERSDEIERQRVLREQMGAMSAQQRAQTEQLQALVAERAAM